MFDVVMMLVFGVRRLPVQEAQVPAGAAGAGAGAGRHGRGQLPPGDAAVARAACRSSGPTRWSAASLAWRSLMLVWPLWGARCKDLARRARTAARRGVMKIAVVGAGAIGGYLGAKLALAGEDVTFIARNRNLEAINAHGFRLILEDGSEQHAPTARAVQHMAEAGPQDAVLLTVKAHQVRDLLPDLRALFGPQTMVVTMINGIPWWYFHKLAGPYEGRRLDSVDPGGVHRRAHRARAHHRQRGLPGGRTGGARRREGDRGQPLHARRARRRAQRAHRGAVAGDDARRLQGAGEPRTSAARSGSSCGATSASTRSAR